jgi:hypothetical protein
MKAQEKGNQPVPDGKSSSQLLNQASSQFSLRKTKLIDPGLEHDSLVIIASLF